MEAESQSVEGPAREIYVHQPSARQLLPAICPACGAPGTTPRPVPFIGAHGPDATLDALYCDICAEEQNTQVTRSLAWLAATALVVVALSTALALAWGTRHVPGQFLLALLVGAILPPTLKKLGAWQVSREQVWLETRGDETRLHRVHRKYSTTLVEHGLELQEAIEFDSDPPQRKELLRRNRHSVFLVCVAAVWLFLLHSLGGAEVRVLVAGTHDAVLLVDARHFGHVSASNSEDPRAGKSVDVLGGRRRFQLVSKSGVILAEATASLWPGRTYIIAHLPEDRCLFSETRKYGKDARASLMVPLAGSGPIWELKNPVDSWFMPLEQPATATNSTQEWQTSGGTRHAIRLLNCRGGTTP